MWALLKTRRWQGFTAIVVFAMVAFAALSYWQWMRAEEKQSTSANIAAASATPVFVAVSDAVTEFAPVVVEGIFRSEAVVLVRNRPLLGTNGLWVVQRLATDEGDVWVLRGWVPAGKDARQSPAVASAPSGRVRVTGVARSLEPGTALSSEIVAELPQSQILELSRAQLPGNGSAWYIQQVSSSPADSLTIVPVPTIDATRNFVYAIQWLIFALVAIISWVFFLRREAREQDTKPERAPENAT